MTRKKIMGYAIIGLIVAIIGTYLVIHVNEPAWGGILWVLGAFFMKKGANLLRPK